MISNIVPKPLRGPILPPAQYPPHLPSHLSPTTPCLTPPPPPSTPFLVTNCNPTFRRPSRRLHQLPLPPTSHTGFAFVSRCRPPSARHLFLHRHHNGPAPRLTPRRFSSAMDPSSLLFDQLKGAGPFFLLAGPNVIESEEHIMKMAKHIKAIASRLGLQVVFKSSFDKANRTSSKSFRGPGLEEGLKILEKVKVAYDLPIVTDVHETIQCEAVGKVADIIQIPAFLCRQTDLLVAAAKTGRIINIKKGQFCAPSVMVNSAEKVRLAGNPNVMVCERGTMFGYNDLIVDPRNLEWMREAHCPVVADITHSLQQPAGRKLEGGGVASGGLRELIPCIARMSVAVGVDGIFMEVHDDPLKAPVDGPTQWPLRHLEGFLEELIAIAKVSKGKQPFKIDLTPYDD